MTAAAAALTRRRTLSLLGAATLVTPMPGRAAGLEALELFGPPAAPSITLAHAVASGAFEPIAPQASFTAWRHPDELRAGLTSGRIELSVAPVQAAANLYNRGFPLRLVNVMTEGLLYVIAADPTIDGIAALKDRTVAVAFRGDTPDFVFRALLAEAKLDADADLTLHTAGTMIESVQLLLAGRVDAALVSEPAASAAIIRGATAGRTITRAIDIQLAWGAMLDTEPVLPQAGLVATDGFLDAHGGVVEPLAAALDAAVERVVAEPARAATDATDALGLPAPILAAAIPHARLTARRASPARAQIERMLGVMAEADIARLGGRMPDDAFYL